MRMYREFMGPHNNSVVVEGPDLDNDCRYSDYSLDISTGDREINFWFARNQSKEKVLEEIAVLKKGIKVLEEGILADENFKEDEDD